MTSSDELERRLCCFLEDLGKELPGRGDETAPYELRVFSALVHSLERDLRALWEGPEISGRPRLSGDDDESDWRKAAAADLEKKNTFVDAIAWVDAFFTRFRSWEESRILPLSQFHARLNKTLLDLSIPQEFWSRIEQRKASLSPNDKAWEIILKKYDEGEY